MALKKNEDPIQVKNPIAYIFVESEKSSESEIYNLPAVEQISSLLKFTCILNQNYQIESITPHLAQELGYETSEIIGKRFLDLIEDQDGEFKNSLEAVFSGKNKVPTKMRYRRRKGTTRCTPVDLLKLTLSGEKKVFLVIDSSFEFREIIQRERDERVKELKCLYLLGSEMEKAKTLHDLLLNTSRHITEGMQFPDICSTVIYLNDEEYAYLKRPQPVVRFIKETIFVRGEKRGSIVVNYHEDREFLREEYTLVSSIAKMLGRAAERFQLNKEREEYTHHLESIVQERVKELEKSRKRYKSLFENAPSGISISTYDGEIITANRAFYRMLKYPEDGSIKPHIIKDNIYCNIKDREYIFEQLDKNGHLADYEFNLNARDGSVITVSGSSTLYQEDGKAYCETILKDITDKKKLEEQLREQKEKLEIKVKKRTEVLNRQKEKLLAMNRQCKATSAELRNTVSKMQTLFDAITDPVISIDKDYNIQMTNQSAFDIGRKCYEVLFNAEKQCSRCPALRATKTGRPASIEVQKDDRFYQLQCYPIFDGSGNVNGVIEWAKDITREKNFCDQMLQTDRLASLGQLVSGIGHELNNPNTFILGNMKIIREAFEDILPILDEKFKKNPDLKIARLDYPFFKEHVGILIEDMERGAERIKTIVQDLKKFASKGENRFDDSISVNQVVQRSLRLVRNQIKRKAEIESSLYENLPPIRANSVGLEQVLVNLIINASDALKDGRKGKINVTTRLDEEQSYVIIEVSDNGVGMDHSTLKQIFNPFFTTKRARGGTGLGLSIAYRIVKEHNGEIEVESVPGEGTTFRVHLPIDVE